MPALPDPRTVRDCTSVDAEVHTTDGCWYIRRLLPYRTPEGGESGLVVTFVDVTALKAAEARLNDLAELLKLAPVLVRDLDDRIVFWDRGAEELYGFSAEEAVGQISHDLLNTVFPRPFEELRAELLRNGTWQGEIVTPSQGRIRDLRHLPLGTAAGRRHPAGRDPRCCCRHLGPEADGSRPARRRPAEGLVPRHDCPRAAQPACSGPECGAAPSPSRRRPDPVVQQQRDVIDRQVGQMKRLLDDLLDAARITRGASRVRKDALDLHTC